MLNVAGYILATLVGLALFWLFGIKAIVFLLKGGSPPCPSSISWIVELPLRKRYMRSVLDRVGIQPGEVILELGPGPGAFTLDAAERVGPEGRIIAVDIQPKMIGMLEKKLEDAGITHVETHIADAYNLPLPDNCVDRAFLVTVLPEIPDEVRALREIRRVLKPGGVLSTTEEFLDPDYPTRKTTVRWAEAAGFHEVERFGSWYLYTLNFG